MVPAHRPGASRRACSPSGIRFSLFSKPSTAIVRDLEGIVAAGATPAAKATLEVYEREPKWFPLIGRALRAGPAHPPVYRLAFFQSLPQPSSETLKGIVAAGATPAAKATLEVYEREPKWFPLIGRALRAGPA